MLSQAQEVASRSCDIELKVLARDRQMSDAEIESLIDSLGEKRRPLDKVRDFGPVRQAIGVANVKGSDKVLK